MILQRSSHISSLCKRACQDRRKTLSTLPARELQSHLIGSRPFLSEGSVFPCTPWQCQVHHLVQFSDPCRSTHGWGEKLFPGPPSPLFRLQGNHQAFNQSSQRWQPHRSPLRPPGSIHHQICIKVEKQSKPVRLKGRCENKRKSL